MSTPKNTPSKPLTDKAAAGKSNADGLINEAKGNAGADQKPATDDQPNVESPGPDANINSANVDSANTGNGDYQGTHGNGPVDDDKDEEYNLDDEKAEQEKAEADFINKVANRIVDVLTERGLTTQPGVLSSTVAEPLPGVQVEQTYNSDDHAANVAKFGEGYIKAQKGEAKQIFTAQAWDLLGADKGGWKRAVEVPAEVQDLKNKY